MKCDSLMFLYSFLCVSCVFYLDFNEFVFSHKQSGQTKPATPALYPVCPGTMYRTAPGRQSTLYRTAQASLWRYSGQLDYLTDFRKHI